MLEVAEVPAWTSWKSNFIKMKKSDRWEALSANLTVDSTE